MNILSGRLVFSNRRILQRLLSSSTVTKMSAGVPVSNLIAALEEFAPKALSESWDNTGLLVEPYTSRPISKILLTNDLTEEVAFEAKKHECEMIISYHPPIFAPLKSVTQRSWKEQLVSFMLENRMYLYSPHTSWDNVKMGVNDWLGSGFPVSQSTPIIPSTQEKGFGAGRLLQLEPKVTLTDAIERVKSLTGLKHVRLGIARGKQLKDDIQTVALCAGSGASVLKGVKADLYLTGEMLHHDVLDATQNGISVILTNHSDSERGFLKVFSGILEKALHSNVKVLVSEFDRDPLVTV